VDGEVFLHLPGILALRAPEQQHAGDLQGVRPRQEHGHGDLRHPRRRQYSKPLDVRARGDCADHPEQTTQVPLFQQVHQDVRRRARAAEGPERSGQVLHPGRPLQQSGPRPSVRRVVPRPLPPQLALQQYTGEGEPLIHIAIYKSQESCFKFYNYK